MQAFKAYKDDSRLRGQAAWDAAQDLSLQCFEKDLFAESPCHIPAVSG